MTHLSAPRCSSHCRCMIIMKLRGRGSVPLDPHADLGRGTRLSPRACAASRDEQGCSRGVCGVGHGARDMGRDGREGQREERHAVVAADSPKRARAAAAAADDDDDDDRSIDRSIVRFDLAETFFALSAESSSLRTRRPRVAKTRTPGAPAAELRSLSCLVLLVACIIFEAPPPHRRNSHHEAPATSRSTYT